MGVFGVPSWTSPVSPALFLLVRPYICPSPAHFPRPLDRSRSSSQTPLKPVVHQISCLSQAHLPCSIFTCRRKNSQCPPPELPLSPSFEPLSVPPTTHANQSGAPLPAIRHKPRFRSMKIAGRTAFTSFLRAAQDLLPTTSAVNGTRAC